MKTLLKILVFAWAFLCPVFVLAGQFNIGLTCTAIPFGNIPANGAIIYGYAPDVSLSAGTTQTMPFRMLKINSDGSFSASISSNQSISQIAPSSRTSWCFNAGSTTATATEVRLSVTAISTVLPENIYITTGTSAMWYGITYNSDTAPTVGWQQWPTTGQLYQDFQGPTADLWFMGGASTVSVSVTATQ
jgi:hypothetical protein